MIEEDTLLKFQKIRQSHKYFNVPDDLAMVWWFALSCAIGIALDAKKEYIKGCLESALEAMERNERDAMERSG